MPAIDTRDLRVRVVFEGMTPPPGHEAHGAEPRLVADGSVSFAPQWQGADFVFDVALRVGSDAETGEPAFFVTEEGRLRRVSTLLVDWSHGLGGQTLHLTGSTHVPQQRREELGPSGLVDFGEAGPVPLLDEPWQIPGITWEQLEDGRLLECRQALTFPRQDVVLAGTRAFEPTAWVLVEAA